MPKSPDPLAELSPLVRRLVALVGRRADDPDVTAFVTDTLGQKPPPASMGAPGEPMKYVVAKKHGLDLGFAHDVKHEAYPLVPKTKKSFVPYLSVAWLKNTFQESLPFGIAFGMEPDEVSRRLGAEPVRLVQTVPVWTRALDPARAIVLKVDARECRVCVDEARELSSRHGVPPLPVVGLFVAWAAHRGLLDPARAGEHTALLEDVRLGKRKGSELLAAAWPRGLWEIHLVDKPGLRQFAFRWFHNLDDLWITRDLIAVFGERTDQYSHKEPVLDDDDAAAVKKATPKLDAVFAPWL